MRLLVSIPCYNESATLEEVVTSIPKDLDYVDKIDILVVDDGSSDGSSAIAERLNVFLISHRKNYGVGRAFQSAQEWFLSHDYDILVTIDADLQFDPMDIPKLIQPIVDNKFDFVSGSRFFASKPLNMPNSKYLGNKLVSRLVGLITGRKISDVSCGFRAFNRASINSLQIHSDFTYTQECFLDLSRKKIDICEIPISVKYFLDRESRVAASLFVYGKKVLQILFYTLKDYYPFKLFSILSLVFFIPGVAFASFFVYMFITSGKFSGYLFSGFLGAYFLSISLFLFCFGMLADTLVNSRR